MRFLLISGLGILLVVFIGVVSAATAPEPARTRSVYFEANKLRDTEVADAAADEWYSANLETMREPSLFHPAPGRQSQAEETYRALASYGRDYLMSIRVERGPTGGTVTANLIDNRPGGKNRTTRRALSQTEWSELTKALSDSDFWNENPPRAHYTGRCVDWVIEGRQKDRYHMVSLSCPTDKGFQELTEVFPTLAGWYPY